MSLNTIVRECGGYLEPFEQSDYFPKLGVIHAYRIGSPETKLEVESDNDAFKGACFGFAMVMIHCKFDFSNFSAVIQSTAGMSQIRGYQFLQRTGNLRQVIDACSPDFQVGAKLHYIKTFRGASAYLRQEKVNFFLCGLDATLDGEDAGHAICFNYESNKFSIFDPNYGVFSFYGKSDRMVMQFLDALSSFDSHYCNPGDGQRFIIGLKPKKRKKR